jgi:hypothetical protein
MLNFIKNNKLLVGVAVLLFLFVRNKQNNKVVLPNSSPVIQPLQPYTPKKPAKPSPAPSPCPGPGPCPNPY